MQSSRSTNSFEKSRERRAQSELSSAPRYDCYAFSPELYRVVKKLETDAAWAAHTRGDAQGSLEEMNMTCDRLRRLRPGQALIYYRGRLDEDIGRSAGVPKYRDLLQTVRETAITLERAGQLVLSKRPADRRIHRGPAQRRQGRAPHSDHRVSGGGAVTAGQMGLPGVVEAPLVGLTVKLARATDKEKPCHRNLAIIHRGKRAARWRAALCRL